MVGVDLRWFAPRVLFSSALPTELTETNSTETCHMFGNEPNLKLHPGASILRGLGEQSPTLLKVGG